MPTAEQQARVVIDQLLAAAGWAVPVAHLEGVATPRPLPRSASDQELVEPAVWKSASRLHSPGLRRAISLTWVRTPS
jgi:hypothetical protein